MKKKFKLTILTLVILLTSQYSTAQDFTKKPNEKNLNEAKQIAKTFFTNFQKGNLEENADFIVSELGNTWDESKKISSKTDYLGKFQIISLSGNKGGVYGKLDGFDLIEQGFLLGSDRYFRHTYIGYHEGSVLIYEFRFYVKPDNTTSLHYIGWSEKNPFEYMSTSDMLFSKY